MKRHCYCIDFNRTRGTLMAAAETASVVCACVGLPLVANAQIVADPNSGANRPTVLTTPNGLPQVNITRPSDAGVSTNHYTRFDVDRAGAILNNSPGITNTQQAGYINGNANLLRGGSARIIVNQANSTLPSQLRGHLEVAGPRAEVIVANPNGIMVDGAGFINTSRATLTTGLPVFGSSGGLDGFRVSGGQISIEGAGLNAADVDQVDLIARAVKANAAVYVNRLNVFAGANQVDHVSLMATEIAATGAATSTGIDVGRLGGMYANKILLASTEQGVGVSLLGVMAAHAGDMMLTSQGRLVMAGSTSAVSDIAVAARDGVEHSGTTYAGNRLHIGTQGALTNDGTLAAGAGLSVNAASIASPGTLAAGANADGVMGRPGNVVLDASGTLRAGTVLAGGDASLRGATIDLSGSVVRANQDVGVSGAVIGSGDMIAGRNVTLDVTGDYLNDATNKVYAHGELTLRASGTITNTGRLESNAVKAASVAFDNTATVIGNDVQVNAKRIANSGSAAIMAAARNLTLNASDTATNTDGATLYSMGNLQIARDGTRASDGMLSNQTGTLINSSAIIEADGHIDIAARELVNKRTSIVTETGSPVETGRQTLTAWMAGFESSGGKANYYSNRFTQWGWTGGQAPMSADMWHALMTPITVEIPGADLTYVDPLTKTLSFSRPPVDEYAVSSGCITVEACMNRPPPTLVERTIVTRPVQHYEAIEDTADGYRVTFWPDWDPARNIRPDEVRIRHDLGPDVHDYNETSRTTVTMTATDRLVSATPPAVIRSLGAIRINADNGSILNQSSTMAAGRDLNRRAIDGTIADVGTALQQTVTTTDTSTFYWHKKQGSKADWTTVVYPTIPQAPTTVQALPAVATSNGAVQTTARDVTVAAVDGAGDPVFTLGAQATVGSGVPNLSLPTNGLHTFHSAPDATYLVATDPRFTDYGKFLSSDYMLGALGLDPLRTQKRLGDGFYEEKLVRDQITQLTGKTFLMGNAGQLAEYKALMDNGVTYARTFNLTPGVGLTDAQMRQLTTNMVWMVSQDVTMPDGAIQSVLVPKVYLAQGNRLDLSSSGALVAGNSVLINASGSVDNSGSIVGDIATQVLGTHIVNRGSIAGTTGATFIAATQDVRNEGGRIGGGDVAVSAGRDVLNTTRTIAVSHDLGNGSVASATTVDTQAIIEGKGRIAILAGRDINLTGSTVDAGDNALLAAGRDIHAETVALRRAQDHSFNNGQGFGHDAVILHQGSNVQAGAGLTAVAGRDMALTGSSIKAGTDLALMAGQDLLVTNATESHQHAEGSIGGKSASFTRASYDETVRGSHLEAGANVRLGAGQAELAAVLLAANGIAATQTDGGGSLAVVGSNVIAGTTDGGGVTLLAKQDIVMTEARELHDGSSEQRSRSSGFLSRKSSYGAISTHTDIGVGGLVIGDTVTAVAANDLNIRHTAIAATDAVSLAASRGDVRITAGQNMREWSATHERSASGLSFSTGNGGIGVSAGSSSGKSTSHTVAMSQGDARSTVGATNGNVTIMSGKEVAIAGSDLIAGRGANGGVGNITIEAANIAITTGIDSVVHDSSQSSRSMSVGMALVGTPLDTLRNLQANHESDSTVTGVRQNLGEIGHSVGTAQQVAVTFGKNSSNATFHTESVRNSGSVIIGAGDITLRATGNGQSDLAGKAPDGDIQLHGSAISASGKATLDAQRHVNIDASTDIYSELTSSSTNGWKVSAAAASLGDIGRNLNGSANNSGVSTLPFGSQNSTVSGDASASQQSASAVTGDAVSIKSRTGDVRIAGSRVAAENDVAIAAKKGRVDLLSGQDSKSQRSDSRTRTIGDLGGDGYTGMSGIRTELHHRDLSGISENTIRSRIESQSGGVNIAVRDDLNARGADIAAGQDVTLIGKNVILDPGTDQSVQNQKNKSSQYGVTLALSGYSIAAAKAAEAAARSREEGKDDKVAALYATQAGLALANSGALGKDLLTSGGKQATEVIKVTVSVGGGSQQSESHSTASNQQGTTIKAGNAVTVVATGSGDKAADGYATDGDISGRGVQIDGKTVNLGAARDLTLESAQGQTSNSSRSSGSNAGIGVGFALGGAQNGFTLELAASQNKARGNGDAVTHQSSHVSATDTLTVTSGHDTNLKGAQLIAETIAGAVGGDLNIESRQDTDNHLSKESSSGMQASICVPPFCAGTTVNATATISSGATNSTYASVREQSGIYAGQGGFDVNVKGHTDLKGGLIASTADASRNRLTTGTLTTSDIENRAEYRSDSSQYAASAGNLANSAMASTAGNAHKPIEGGTSGTTRSAIATGTVTITDEAAQQVKTGKTVEESLDSLNRDTEGANQHIDKIFDERKIKDERTLEQLTGQTMQQAAPILYDGVGNALKGQPEHVKIAVHGLVGGLVSKALGGDFGTGAVGVAAATAAIAVLDESLGGLGVDATTKDRLLQLVGMTVAGSIGGNAAAGTAGMADAYNRQLHPEEKGLARKIAAQAIKEGITNPDGTPVTVDQIENAMRSANNSKYGETSATGVLVSLNASTKPSDIYDTAGMFVVNDGVGHSSLMQAPSMLITPSQALQSLIEQNTGGTNSPYSWNNAPMGLVSNVYTTTNPYVARTPCSTTDCIPLGRPGAGFDYVALNIGLYIMSAGAVVNMRDGSITGQWALGRAYPGYTNQLGLTITAGSILGDNSAAGVRSFTTGGGASAGAFAPVFAAPFIGLGGAVSYAYGGGTATEVGISFPAGTYVNPVGYGFRVNR